MGDAQWLHCHPVSAPFLPRSDPPPLAPSRQKLQLALVTRRKQLMPRLEMLKTAPIVQKTIGQSGVTHWRKDKVREHTGEKTWTYGPRIAQTSDTIFNLQPISAY